MIVGISGFILLEKYNLREAFYMTVITISTVGFKEVRELSPAGQVFTSFYIIFNLLTIAYVISVVSAYVFEGQLQAIFKYYMINQDLKKMANHIIVCGYGRNGSRASFELLAAHETVVAIEANRQLVKTKALTTKNLIMLLGDATQDEVLQKAGIARAKAVITTLPKDADNVFVVLTARELNKTVRIISRASEKNTEAKLLRAGANNVVMPEEIGGIHMANLVTRPDVIQFLEMLDGLGSQHLHLEEVRFQDLDNNLRHRTIREMAIQDKTGATVIGLKNQRQQFIINPDPDSRLSEGDVLLVLGTNFQIQTFGKLFRRA